MSLSVNTYSFRCALDAGRTIEQCLYFAADTGFYGVEIVPECTGSEDFGPKQALEFKKMCDRYGLKITGLCYSADLLNDKEPEKIKSMVDTAADIGVSVMRHDTVWQAGGFRTFKNILPYIADICRDIAEYAAQKGVKTCTENHGFYMQNSLRMERLVEEVDCENFGLLVDIGNFLCVDDDPITAVGRTAPYAFMAHIKDFLIKDQADQGMITTGGRRLIGAAAGEGDVPVRQCVLSLLKAGFDGTFCIEYEAEEDPFTALPRAFKYCEAAVQDAKKALNLA